MWSQRGGNNAHRIPKIVQRTSAPCWPNGTASFSFAVASNSTFRSLTNLIKDEAEVVEVKDDSIPMEKTSFPTTILKTQTSAKMTKVITVIHGTDSPEINPNRGGVAIKCIILRSNTSLLIKEEHPLASPAWVVGTKVSPEQFERCVVVKYCRYCAFDNDCPISRSFLLVYCLCLRACAGLLSLTNVLLRCLVKCIQCTCAIYECLSFAIE
jgi:hypothetical protein